MREQIMRLVHRLPLSFRVLFSQFLLRVVDLEALSIEADIPRFLGQFAALLLFFSFTRAASGLFLSLGTPLTRQQVEALSWHLEQQFMAQMFFVIGITSVLIWDAIFPDKRDAMILTPLPVRPHIVLQAKLGASCAVLGLAILSLNILSVPVWFFLLGQLTGNFLLLPAIGCALLAISIFVYGCVLTVQGAMALLLPRRWFLQLSSLMQLTAFGYFLASFFLTPDLDTPALLSAPANQMLVNCTPTFWFFALIRQLSGSLNPQFAGLAWRAWIALLSAMISAAALLFWCYQRILRKIVEAPDMQPGWKLRRWQPRMGNTLAGVILLFCIRSVMRSRQHRLALAVYLSMIGAIALSLARDALAVNGPRPLNLDYLVASFMMMALAVIGLRSIFSLPISLTANWMLRVTQLSPTAAYVEATRMVLAVLAILPVCVLAGALGITYRPLPHVAFHLALLALIGLLITELSLVGFYKVPFTCSYLPGKVSIQLMFCILVLSLIVFSSLAAEIEQPALASSLNSVGTVIALAGIVLTMRILNQRRARSAEIYFEDQYPNEITTLGISMIKPQVP